MSIPDRSLTESGRYLRYDFRTGEIDGVSGRVLMMDWSPFKLAPIGIFLRTAKTIRDFQIIEQHRLARLKVNPFVETDLVDEYDLELADVAHR